MARKDSISLAKGIAILLMVVAHAGIQGIAHDVIYVFHMPLFFFVSGYCLRIEPMTTNSNTWVYIKKKLKKLWWPYVKWSIVFLSIHYLLCFIPKYQYITSGNTNFVEFLKRCIMVTFTMSKTPDILGGYWFLKILFLTTIATYLCLKIKYNPKMYLLFVFVLLIGVKLISIDNTLTYHVGLLLYAISFYLTGILLKNWSFEQNFLTWTLEGIVLFLVAVFFPSEMSTVSWNNLLPCYIGAICGIGLVLSLCKIIETSSCIFAKSVLLFCGNHTLEILTWHFLMFKIVSGTIIYQNGLSWQRIADTPIIDASMTGDYAWIAYSLFAIMAISLMVFTKEIIFHAKDIS